MGARGSGAHLADTRVGHRGDKKVQLRAPANRAALGGGALFWVAAPGERKLHLSPKWCGSQSARRETQRNQRPGSRLGKARAHRLGHHSSMKTRTPLAPTPMASPAPRSPRHCICPTFSAHFSPKVNEISELGVHGQTKLVELCIIHYNNRIVSMGAAEKRSFKVAPLG